MSSAFLFFNLGQILRIGSSLDQLTIWWTDFTSLLLQHWFKDEKYSTRVKDQEGFPAFSLVNKATGEAIKHSIGATHPVTSRFSSNFDSFAASGKPIKPSHELE